jgi:cysteine desulfurase
MTASGTIYLDNHSTTRLDPRVLDAMLPWLTDHYGNAGSTTHELGLEARAAVERARETFAAAIGGESREIVFTSGATESANLAILGAASRAAAAGGRGTGRGTGRGHIVTLASEHHAVLDPIEHLERSGVAVTRLPVAPQRDGGGAAVGLVPGSVPPAAVAAALEPDTFLVSVLLANNEIGVVQDVPAIAAVVHDAGGLLHLDCAQAVGRLPIDMDALGADLASFSAHKFHGPKGAGALYVRRRGRAVRLDPLVFGGGQERGLRSGTLAVPTIVGLAEAARLADEALAEEPPRLRVLRDRLWQALERSVPDVAVNGPPLDAVDAAGRPRRLVNNLNVRIPGVDGQTLLATLSAAGLAVSSGSACSSESPRPSHVLMALGLDEDEARSSLRFGLSRFTTEAEVEEAAARVAAGVARLR